MPWVRSSTRLAERFKSCKQGRTVKTNIPQLPALLRAAQPFILRSWCFHSSPIGYWRHHSNGTSGEESQVPCMCPCPSYFGWFSGEMEGVLVVERWRGTNTFLLLSVWSGDASLHCKGKNESRRIQLTGDIIVTSTAESRGLSERSWQGL